MKKLTPRMLAEQQRIEQELSEIPTAGNLKKLLSLDGFVDYYLEMREVYTTHLEAYEALESHYERITGRRRYSEFHSFRVSLDRYVALLKLRTRANVKIV